MIKIFKNYAKEYEIRLWLKANDIYYKYNKYKISSEGVIDVVGTVMLTGI
jgi:hypothetical protein